MDKMPDSFKGKVYKKSKYLKTAPREWTALEIEYLIEMNSIGFSSREIAESMDRSEVSVSVKLKRLGKKNNRYEGKHSLEKRDIDTSFVQRISPSKIITLMGGTKELSYTSNMQNEVYNKVNSSFGESALKILAKKYIEDEEYDYIDLDTFASCYDAFDLAIKMAKKGLAITLGELGHKRFKRLDFVERYYQISDMKDFTLDNLITHIQKIGLRNKKKLVVYNKKEWTNVGRVWFMIEPIKVLDVQFDNEKVEKKKSKKNIEISAEIYRPTLFDYLGDE